MPPKLVSELTEEDYKGYLFWLNYCCREGGCMVCDRPFCEGREKKMFMEVYFKNGNNKDQTAGESSGTEMPEVPETGNCM